MTMHDDAGLQEDDEVLFVDSNAHGLESNSLGSEPLSSPTEIGSVREASPNLDVSSEVANRPGEQNYSIAEANQPSKEQHEPKTSQNGLEKDPPTLDPVQLASIFKDFEGPTDALFKGCPEYMAAIVKEMLEHDFLLVLGRGLGLSQILNLFLAKVKQVCPNALVLVLGRRNEEEEDDAIIATKTEASNDEPKNENTIAFGISAAKRAKMYKRGGIYHITAPIAVVDILTGNLDCSTVSGLVIAHGENIQENSTAAFFIKLLRERNKIAFIKALCDAPERLIQPPTLPLRLRVLHAQTIMLWPRFHLIVDRSLPRLEVDEIIVEQSVAVRRQQALLTELMQSVISDVKRRVPHLDVEFLAPALGSQQPHENPEQLHALTTADAVLASPDLPWKIRNALKSVWHQLSREGKRSVHSLGTLQQLQRTLTEFDALSFWSQLDFACRDSSEPWVMLPAADTLLSEAQREAALNRLPGKFHHVKELVASIPAEEKVLILCESAKTVFDLHGYLSRSDEESAEDVHTSKALEKSMKEAEDKRARVRAAEYAAKVNEGRPGRRRVRGGKAPTPDRGTGETPAGDNQIKEEPESTLYPILTDAVHPPVKRKYEQVDLTDTLEDEQQDLEIISQRHQAHITFGTYRGAKPLQSWKPDHVIMYDPDLQFTREIERYVATIPEISNRPSVHFMYYQKSIEELQYLTTMRKEKDAFAKLIREKGLMPMVLRDGEPENGSEEELRVIGNSRRNYQVVKGRQRVVVDTREFRSALPFLIWQTRMDVVPVTLSVGDYVLTPEIVVERKSVTDLIGSFRDGRLYAQCESMMRHYKIAVLLIEFDHLSHFSMEPFKDIRSRQSADIQREIQDNLTALLLRFPKLKLIWSASPLHSAQIFQGLKEMEQEPEPEECAKAGQFVLYDSIALSVLESMPGVTPRNLQLLAKRASTLTEICELSRVDIIEAIGPENGDKLHRFITMRRPT